MEAVLVCFMTAHLAVIGWSLLTLIGIQRSMDILFLLPTIKKEVTNLKEVRKAMANGHFK